MGKTRRGQGRLRVFAVIGEIGEGDELDLHRVLTWPSFAELRQFCDPAASAKRSPWDLVSKQVMLGERGAAIMGGMSIPVGIGEAADSWMVKLGDDRALRELREGETVTLLDSVWHGGHGSAIWQVYGRAGGSVTVTASGLRVAGIPGVNT